MSILDDAIREHLELKRAHGADEAELKKLEDEAFGPPGRPEEPDPFAEAPTEFMATAVSEAGETEDEGGRRRINIADLQEPPPPDAAEQQEEPRVEAVPEIEPQAEATPLAPAEDAAQAASPAEEPPVVEEVEELPVADEAEEPAGDEREAIAEQPTELFDVEAEMGSEAAPAAEAPSPSDEQIVEAEREEPRLVPVADDEEDEEDEEFWNEQRLSDELDQALEAPLTEEHPLPPAPAPEEQDSEEHEQPKIDYDPDTGHEDVLEDTPEFLEESPEDDELWFEQKPPKDFDFDD
jgi:hypothetical protein